MPNPTKHDANKPKMDLIPPMPLVEIAKVFTFGARKYGAHNYLLNGGLPHSRLYAATLRHLTAYHSGQDMDPESGLPHLAHAVASLLMLMQSQNDDRPNWGGFEESEPKPEADPEPESEPTPLAELEAWLMKAPNSNRANLHISQDRAACVLSNILTDISIHREANHLSEAILGAICQWNRREAEEWAKK